jgi:ribosomal protein S10
MSQTCLFIIKSKNKKSIFNFLKFFKGVTKKVIKSRLQKKRLQEKRYKRITLLKSPHVHKSAQTQFESRIYKKQIVITLLGALNFLIVIKKLLNYSFYDLKITINFFLKGRKQKPAFLSLTDFYFNHKKKYSNNFIGKNNQVFLWHVRKFKTYQFVNLLQTAGVVLKI